MSWWLSMKPSLNHFQFQHTTKDIFVNVTRAYVGDLRNYDDTTTTMGLAFHIQIGSGTLLAMEPDGGHGWTVRDLQEGEETKLITKDELVELLMMIVANIQPEPLDGRMSERWS